MEPDFWLERWRNDEIGFHQRSHNPWLMRFWPCLDVPREAAVFVPLCGKSLDMRWLEARGHRVYGVDLSELAIRAYFAEGGETWERVRSDYAYVDGFVGPRAVLYCGNLLDVAAPDIPGTQAVFDRAALIALPPPMRARYADHLLRVVPEGARMLLITLEYRQELVSGPPFAVFEDEVQQLYGARCRVERLDAWPATALPPKFAELGSAGVREVGYKITKLR
jgi:thiopurine S-methyltransferase